MFKKTIEEDTALDGEINRLLNDMAIQERSSKEYQVMTDQLVKLYALKPKKPETRVSPDTLALVLGNLAGILVLVSHEKAHVVTSKALSFILKAR